MTRTGSFPFFNCAQDRDLPYEAVLLFADVLATRAPAHEARRVADLLGLGAGDVMAITRVIIRERDRRKRIEATP